MSVASEKPIRLAVLGGSCTGKTSFISRLTVDIVREAHYPTRKQNNWLFTFNPTDPLARAILDEKAHERYYYSDEHAVPEPVFRTPSITDHVLLSPPVYQSFIQNYQMVKHALAVGQRLADQRTLLKSDNQYYQYKNEDVGHGPDSCSRRTARLQERTRRRGAVDRCLPSNYTPPRYSSISIDIIDTPAYDPDMVIPFLEVSLFSNLDKSILRGLADHPRKPVSTQSLLVASGASELNGKVDGYIFVYSALPELNYAEPPSYDSLNRVSGGVGQAPAQGQAVEYKRTSAQDGGFSLLSSIRACFLDAWTEFRNYQRRAAQIKEGDIYSLMYSLKQAWKPDPQATGKDKGTRELSASLDQIDLNPDSPNSPPPMLIICTHILDPLHSPLLVEHGKRLAVEWKCAFVALDSMSDFNVDVAMACIIRDIVEKEKLLNKHITKKKGVLHKIIKG
ncbi:ADL382Cp [Eremothecium gossypii ATCC 10895]|uniref:ADL382Cp n=1 Tax=Eremothecium gossypii (strain ATCC 10895 / CBS 109.51 / FGSC 9923 / NRRL Y-1056) TaxID=284811 RepID=Q75BE6_EREGS|nr:ADL382Cp [Eremothecium gossypii ATCC 10895]AAS51538.1 ADL382Cp [Eremothecium gossypii ATCC 10895]AEY95834.1 FADL382Cp [Eremothecium gossypii FDAG1]